MDGFRALAHVGPDETRLESRKGNVFRSFADLAAAIHIDLDSQAVLDGEVVVLDRPTEILRTAQAAVDRASRSSMPSICLGSMARISDRIH